MARGNRRPQMPKDRVEAIAVIAGSAYQAAYEAVKEANLAKGIPLEPSIMRAAQQVFCDHPEYYEQRLLKHRAAKQPHKAAELTNLVTASVVREADHGDGVIERTEQFRQWQEDINDPNRPVDYELDSSQFNPEEKPTLDIVKWVAQNLDLKTVEPGDAPNTLAWSMLMHYRQTRKTREDFWNKCWPLVLKMEDRQRQQEEAEAAKRGEATDAAMEQCEQFLMALATEA